MMIIDRLATAGAGKFAAWLARRRMHFDAQPVAWPPPAAVPERVRQLYVHIPFCPQLCPFCTFHRVRFRADRSADYFGALRRELDWYRQRGFAFSKLYVGGGTPTVDPDALERLLADVHDRFPVEEISVETNPHELNAEVLDMLERAGVSRVSVGVQSFDDDQLRRMGRFEAYGSGAQICERLAAAAGRFQTLNVDMMFNLPGQTPESLAADLATLLTQPGADQVSYYPLMIAPTAHRSVRLTMARGRHALTAGHEHEYYDMIRSTLTPAYEMGTVWCFRRGAGAIDEYIVDEDEYVGAGSGAFSYLAGHAASVTFSILGYQQRMAAGGVPVSQTRRLDESEQILYDLLVKLFALRLDKGAMENKHHGRFASTLRTEIALLKLLGAIEDNGPCLQLTERGLYLWLVLMREYLTGVNALRSEMRRRIRDELRQFDSVPE